MATRDEYIIDVWERMEKEVAGASELNLIQEAVLERFGTPVSPAAIARTLADHNVRLGHPQILEADLQWRERASLFTPDDLTFGTLYGATLLMDKIENLRQQFELDQSGLEHLRQSVFQLKNELEIIAASPKSVNKDLAEEVAQWLTVWLHNPPIFTDWLALRRNTADFQDRFL
ncbi:MAG TPA: hypothetical protein VFR78_19305 [Pyrinomonadaceae bacterium]|nr:hypothetical protein [Pyrinomonadaceae bacterium]